VGVWLILNGGVTYGHETDSYELALVDMNGDGAADHVLKKADHPLRQEEQELFYVKLNAMEGKNNLLESVSGPLGSRIDLEYERTPNTVDMPASRMVLSKVRVSDGQNLGIGFESPDLVTEFSYSDGFYDRSEKQFFGFKKVSIFTPDTAHPDPANPSVFLKNTTTLSYHVGKNNHYALQGRLASEEVRDGISSGNPTADPYKKVSYEYRLVPILQNGSQYSSDTNFFPVTYGPVDSNCLRDC
jgi:hypothetical protein